MFQNNIEAATQMKSVMGSDSRPNCLIIDEIDGAPQVCYNFNSSRSLIIYIMFFKIIV